MPAEPVKVVGTIRNLTFGYGGPYRLSTDTPEPLRGAVWKFTQMEAARLEYRRRRAEAVLDAQPLVLLDASLCTVAQSLVHDEAHARGLFYSTGNRWTVVVVAGWYCCLSDGLDEHGARVEPYLVFGKADGTVQCPGCDGCGKRVYRRDLGKQVCFTCKGKGRYSQELPDPVRKLLEAAPTPVLADVLKGVAHVD